MKHGKNCIVLLTMMVITVMMQLQVVAFEKSEI